MPSWSPPIHDIICRSTRIWPARLRSPREVVDRLDGAFAVLVEILDRTLDKELDKIMAKGIEQVEKIYKDHMSAHGWVDHDVGISQ